ncbi:MAG: hypothetical protein K0Q74_1506, partial [Gammaproteobacteria bacterium]|nr:hypothetical protein [Gammaproteobacteria bacterium]
MSATLKNSEYVILGSSKYQPLVDAEAKASDENRLYIFLSGPSHHPAQLREQLELLQKDNPSLLNELEQSESIISSSNIAGINPNSKSGAGANQVSGDGFCAYLDGIGTGYRLAGIPDSSVVFDFLKNNPAAA